eukprot:UN01525
MAHWSTISSKYQAPFNKVMKKFNFIHISQVSLLHYQLFGKMDTSKGKKIQRKKTVKSKK